MLFFLERRSHISTEMCVVGAITGVQEPADELQVDRSRSDYYKQWGSFQQLQIPGFVNTGLPGKRSCDTLRYNSTIGVQPSFYLKDDIKQIALTLDHHPSVDYPDELMSDPDMRVDDIVEKTWARRSGSSVWLPEQQVYLAVTRVVFSPSRTRSKAKMSFLRGQLFNEDWEHLENHTISWSGNYFTFPTVFNIPGLGEEDENYGPEDPRVVLENSVEGAEPVIIFNMVGLKSDWRRAMYLFLPFSGQSTILTIKDEERLDNEKDWAPFFVPTEQQQTFISKIPLPISTAVRNPNEYVHFVYTFRPLRILKCHMRCGDCEFEYEQDLPDSSVSHEEQGTLRGGTNFVPVPIPSSMDIDPRVQVYAGFPQTNIEKYCGGNFFRPELMVMINIGKQFQLSFASESLAFGNAILEMGAQEDQCDKRRILSPNSIARWDTSNGQDIMSMSLGVNDETVQVARIEGLLTLVKNLPQFKTLLKRDGLLKGANTDLMSILTSWVGDDVRGCLLESVANYTGSGQDSADPVSEEEEMDLSNELMDRLQQIQDEEASQNKKPDPPEAMDRGFNPAGVYDLDHPPADEDFMFHPELLGEFEDVEGLAVDGLEEEGIEEDEKEVKMEDEKKVDDENEEPKDDHGGKIDGPMEEIKKDEEPKAANPPGPPKPKHGHRYHKNAHQNARRMWP